MILIKRIPKELKSDLPIDVTFYWQHDSLASVDITEGTGRFFVEGDSDAQEATKDWLYHYFRGHTRPLCVAPAKTPFCQSVLDELGKIPLGTTMSYSELAARLGNKNSSRAVGGACGRNHLPLVIPCHRIVCKNQGLGGFNKGVFVKKVLLQLEKSIYDCSKK